MNRLTTYSLVTSFLALAPALTAACLTGSVTCFVPRTPHGIYAMVGIAQYEHDYLLAHSRCPRCPRIISAALFIRNCWPIRTFPGSRFMCTGPAASTRILLRHPLRLQDTFNHDWSLVQDLLDQAGAAKKTVQLIVTPGINSPTWLLGDIDGKNDGLLKKLQLSI